MNWIASYLAPLGAATILAGALMIGFMVKKKETAAKWTTWFFVILLVLLGVAGWKVLTGSPGLEETVDETARDKRPRPIANLLDRLRQPWDSEQAADWPAAESIAQVCSLAYLAPVDAEEAYRNLGFEETKTFADASMIGYVISAEDVAVVVFRGTDNPADWFCNLDQLTGQTPHGPIHRGFQRAYLPLKQQIVKLLNRQRPRYLWLVGHSLGGALALVCASDLIAQENLAIHGVMTFGQPMVAGNELAAHLDKALLGKFAHFVNESDLVPRVPPSFKHCGSLVWFTQGTVRRSKPKRVVFGDRDPPQPAESNSDVLPPLTEREFEEAKENAKIEPEPRMLPDGTPVFEGNLPFFKDHAMELYLEKIHGQALNADSKVPTPR